MKTIRETLDQLDEISRRNVLKGAGAAALGAATGTATGQTIGGGEDETKEEALKAATAFYNMSRKSNLAAARMIQSKISQRLMQFYNFGGQDLSFAANIALNRAIDSVTSTFNQAYAQAEKNKQDHSIVGAYMSKRLGLDQLSQQQQLKISGSLDQFDLMPLAEHFVKVYTQSLQLVLDGQKRQRQQPVEPSSTQTQPPTDPDLDKKRREQLQRMSSPDINVKEDSLEEASPEAIAKIDKLSR